MHTFTYTTTSRTILADLYTPVSVYMRLRDLYPQSALMESSDYHDQSNARSFIGINPIGSVAIAHGLATIAFPDGTTHKQTLSPEFGTAEAIHTLIDRIHVAGDDASTIGLFGYTSFNAVRYFENIDVKDETQAKNDAPDVLYILYKVVIVFDHHNNQLKIVTLDQTAQAPTAPPTAPERLRVGELCSGMGASCALLSGVQGNVPPSGGEGGAAAGTIDTILKAMNRANVKAYDFHSVGDVRSTLTDDEHKANIRRGIQHCLRGDVFQIVLSRRFIQRYEGDDFKLYRALRSINPSPYLFYFDFGGFRIFGSSPETHCRIEGQATARTAPPSAPEGATNACKPATHGNEAPSGAVGGASGAVGGALRMYIDPIAGTTKRTGDAEADRRGAEFLRQDPKENAEHVMLVDLARNDLSRNCHGVKVDYYKDIQYYSHVIHLVSRVSGELDADKDPIKAFIDTFPAGTLSGAPKVRAMQLISEYEPHSRGAYGGCIGMIGLDGTLNQAITIRTFVSRNGELWFQAGGGIVAKSNEEYELHEVNNKLGALRRAIAMAECL